MYEIMYATNNDKYDVSYHMDYFWIRRFKVTVVICVNVPCSN